MTEFAISEVAFPHTPSLAQMRLAPKCPKMPTLGNPPCPMEPGRVAGHSPECCGYVPGGIKPTAALGGGLALELVSPAKATCDRDAEALQERLGWAQREERAFPLNSPPLLGLLQGSGAVPAKDGRGGGPPKHTLETVSVSASSLGTLEDPLSALCT